MDDIRKGLITRIIFMFDDSMMTRQDFDKHMTDINELIEDEIKRSNRPVVKNCKFINNKGGSDVPA